MNVSYSDILDAAFPKLPLWWDRRGVPRFVEYAPGLQSVYADQDVLLQVSCQGCGRLYEVGVCREQYMGGGFNPKFAVEQGHRFYYGDPPNNCCEAGATMTAIPRRVIQFWMRGTGGTRWERRSDLEVIFPDEDV